MRTRLCASLLLACLCPPAPAIPSPVAAAQDPPPRQDPPRQPAPTPAPDPAAAQPVPDVPPVAQEPDVAIPAKPPLRGFVQHDVERAATRLVYFHETPAPAWDHAPGQIAIEYAKLRWLERYAKSVKALRDPAKDAPPLQRWRLGRDFWTNLDAGLPLHIGGTRIEPGYYYLALEYAHEAGDAGGAFRLCVIDPAALRARGIDAWHVARKDIPVLASAPLRFTEDEDAKQETLEIRLRMDAHDVTRADLTIAFGPYELKADVVVEVE